MLRVALTGGIGSGKSEVARLLAECGAIVIDSDQLAREVVEPGTAGLAAVVEAFGPGVLTSDGRLDRERLAAIVFADAAARERLNAIVHPLVRAAAADVAAGVPGDAVVVHDIPLLVEAGLTTGWDRVVVVAASPSTQLDRLVRLRGMDPVAAQARIDAQLPLADKIAVADTVIVNDGTLADLAEQVTRLWADLRRPT
jgi:dephospho-CoA kinase